MSAEQAWDHFVRQVMNVAGGIEEPTRAIAAGKLYAAHAVAEARAPLVEALRAALHALTTYQGLWASDECRDGGDYSFQLSDTALLDQITDILGPPTGQPEAGDATEMHGV